MPRNGRPQIPDGADRFTIYTDRASGEAWRLYCLDNGLAMSAVMTLAMNAWIKKPVPKRKSLRLPPGPRVSPELRRK